MDVEKKIKLLESDYKDWSDDDLNAFLTEKYEPSVIPPCRVCGGPLSISSCGGGQATRWACSGLIDAPDDRVVYAEGRCCADRHYADSIYTDYRSGGDGVVMELIRRFTKTLSKPDPERVRLTADYSDPASDIEFPKGTVLVRASGGTYITPGTKLGGKCITMFSLIKKVCVIDHEENPKTYQCACCGFDPVPLFINHCPACWNHRDGDREAINKHREAWTERGMLWQSNTIIKPRSWNPMDCLAKLALKITLDKVRGRPPSVSLMY